MRTIQIPGLILVILCLSACGIDRGGITQDVAFAGAVVAGKIDSIDAASNKVVINGHEQSLSSTNILINGTAANSAQLTVGVFAVATTTASGQPGQPQRLELDYNVAGGETAPGTSSDNIVQIGQSINLNNLNAPVPVADLTVPGSSDYAFSGYVTGSGEIDATASIAYPASEPILLTGIARNVDANQFTFTIGSQIINYSQAQVITTQTGMIQENARLRIELASNSSNAAINALGITEVALIDATLGENATISVTGYNDGGQSAASFSVFGLNIITDSNTVYENNPQIALAVDSLLLIEGVLRANGAVLAKTVRQLN